LEHRRFLGESAVRVDENRCRIVAATLGNIHCPRASEDSSPIGIDPRWLPNVYFLAVAVCHQTSPLNGPRLAGHLETGRHAVGWDYLRLRLAERVAAAPSLVEPARWAEISGEDVAALLADARGVQTLSDANGRAALINDLGRNLTARGVSDVTELYEEERGALDRRGRGLLPRLQQFHAYRDPVRKKSYFFLELMHHACGWAYRDMHHLGAPVDYHEVRGHLRLGTVVVNDDGLRAQISKGSPVDEHADVQIRGGVAAAIARISALTGRSMSDLHYLFWNVFRNCCSRAIQHCSSCPATCALPHRYVMAPRREDLKCLFALSCRSVGIADKLLEHVHHTDFY
jgi:hypothetical protein